MEEKIILNGTTKYFEAVDLETSKKLRNGELVFLNMPLPVGCNYKCLKCFSSGSDAYNQDLKDRGIIPSFTEFQRKSLITEAREYGAKSLIIAGAGEPLLYPMLDDLLSYTGNIGMNSVVFTNGLGLSEERAKHLFNSGASIVFSYDSTNPEVYDILTGTTGNHDKVRSNLEKALLISEQYSKIVDGVKVVSMAVNTNLSKLTYNPGAGIDDVAKIHNLIGGSVAHYVSDITPNGYARENWEILAGTDNFAVNTELREVVRKYSKGSGGSSRKIDDNCSYIYNGVVAYEGHYMICPNFGAKVDFGKYPEISVEKHFIDKKIILKEMKNPSCATRS